MILLLEVIAALLYGYGLGLHIDGQNIKDPRDWWTISKVTAVTASLITFYLLYSASFRW